jgi:glycosyltransferase involved in cell wall biosynthesis
VETLESVAAQTYSPIELIVIDDGSTDDTFKVVKDWEVKRAPECKSIRVMKCYQQPNSGPSAARNHGFRESKGEFIQFLDSDDILEPNKIETQSRVLLENPNLDFCVCNYVRVNSTNTFVISRFDLSNYPHTIESFPAQYPMNSVTPLYRRGVIERAGGYDEQLRAGEDFEFNFRVMLSGTGTWIGSYLVRCRTHESEERIQAGDYSRWFNSLALGLVKMELAAIHRGVSSKALELSIGKKAMSYETAMWRELETQKAQYFRRMAHSYMGLTNYFYWALRLWVRARLKKY